MGIAKWWNDAKKAAGVVDLREKYPLAMVDTKTSLVSQLEIVKAFSYPCTCGYSLIYPIPEVDHPIVVGCDMCGVAYQLTWKGDHFISRPTHELAIPDANWRAFKERFKEELRPKEENRGFFSEDPPNKTPLAGDTGRPFTDLGGFGKPPEVAPRKYAADEDPSNAPRDLWERL